MFLFFLFLLRLFACGKCGSCFGLRPCRTPSCRPAMAMPYACRSIISLAMPPQDVLKTTTHWQDSSMAKRQPLGLSLAVYIEYSIFVRFCHSNRYVRCGNDPIYTRDHSRRLFSLYCRQIPLSHKKQPHPRQPGNAEVKKISFHRCSQDNYPQRYGSKHAKNDSEDARKKITAPATSQKENSRE